MPDSPSWHVFGSHTNHTFLMVASTEILICLSIQIGFDLVDDLFHLGTVHGHVRGLWFG